MLYQAYFLAYLVLTNIGVPVNPGSMYILERKLLRYFRGTTIRRILSEIRHRKPRAAAAAWWFSGVGRRRRRQMVLVLAAAAKPSLAISTIIFLIPLERLLSKYENTRFRKPAPEGAPTHRLIQPQCDILGACITVLKFFFDNYFRTPLVPTSTLILCRLNRNEITVNSG